MIYNSFSFFALPRSSEVVPDRVDRVIFLSYLISEVVMNFLSRNLFAFVLELSEQLNFMAILH